MNKTEMLDFIKETRSEDDLIKKMTQEKIEQFLAAQIKLFNELDAMIADFFPEEIMELCDQYISSHRAIICNSIWIDVLNNNCICIRLNPNDYAETSYSIGQGTAIIMTPTSLGSLDTCVRQLKKYQLLADTLKSEISNIYKTLCDWKTASLKSQMTILNNISFPEAEKKPERYRVTISVEKIL